MNTKAELQWLIEFGQKDLDRIRHKTRQKLTEELHKKIERLCSFWGAIPKDYSGLFNYEPAYYNTDRDVVDDIAQQEYLLRYQEGAEKFVEDLKGTFKRESGEPFDPARTRDFNSVEIKFWSFIPKTTNGVFNTNISVGSEPEELVYFFMSMLLTGTKIADFKDCAYCSKLFLQVSREKKFCTRNCAANSAKG